MNAAPCSVPRCALEWVLATHAFVQGLALGIASDPRLELGRITLAPGVSFHMDGKRWMILLLLTAALQFFALIRPDKPHSLQRWSAGIACFSWSALAIGLFQGHLVTYALSNAILSAIVQLYICTLLRGARWKA